jgi:hypothetical protein
MAIADDRKTITDNDVRTVIATIRSVQVTTVVDVVDPFDTPTAPLHASHEAGYGHGV